MNVLVTGSKGYIGKSIINSKIKGINFIEGHRNNINLFDKNYIKEFIKCNKIDSIIHCAIEGGSRLKNDDSNIFYNNLLIFENLCNCKNLIYKFINIASGAEFDKSFDINLKLEEEIFDSVPKDYYGLSKNIISQKAVNIKNFYNLRIFGCFDENEIETRFIKTCILKSLKNEPIIINEDKTMDFFYLKDLIPVIENVLLNQFLYKDINLSYQKKYKLSEIAKNISSINKSKSKIIIQKKDGLNYNGDYNKFISLPIKTQGIDKGILTTISKLQ